MNAKTWQSIGGFSLALFLAVVAFFIFPPSHPLLRYLSNACIGLLVILCIIGAWFGFLLCLGRLYFGCPFCGSRSQVVGGTKKDLYLECPSCGHICVTARPFRAATATKLDADTE
jgi:hypothetical protein